MNAFVLDVFKTELQSRRMPKKTPKLSLDHLSRPTLLKKLNEDLATTRTAAADSQPRVRNRKKLARMKTRARGTLAAQAVLKTVKTRSRGGLAARAMASFPGFRLGLRFWAFWWAFSTMFSILCFSDLAHSGIRLV